MSSKGQSVRAFPDLFYSSYQIWYCPLVQTRNVGVQPFSKQTIHRFVLKRLLLKIVFGSVRKNIVA